MRFLVIDNYDSFVYNIVQYLGELGIECHTIRNDKITPQQVIDSNYDAIIISPGPGTPDDKRYFGACMDVIKEAGPRVPILGICLGHQGIISAFGGHIGEAAVPRHGKTSKIRHTGAAPFSGVPSPFVATRYHSLSGAKTQIPDSLEVTAVSEDDGEVMAVRHKRYPIIGVQFHPESIMTPEGKKILGNFIDEVARC